MDTRTVHNLSNYQFPENEKSVLDNVFNSRNNSECWAYSSQLKYKQLITSVMMSPGFSGHWNHSYEWNMKIEETTAIKNLNKIIIFPAYKCNATIFIITAAIKDIKRFIKLQPIDWCLSLEQYLTNDAETKQQLIAREKSQSMKFPKLRNPLYL